MGSTFNSQILIDKLTKLNSSQTSIETLSHWCIFHMNKAKQVVETWDRQFHSAPREQRLALLYLANDILQNSRRKGSDFVGEFWKVLPGALRDVVENGDEFGRSAALRLVNIWDERKVFGSRGQALKEEFAGRHQENNSRNGKESAIKANIQKQPVGGIVDKIVSGFQVVHGGQVDEEAIMNKCRNSISFFENVEKEMGGNTNSDRFNESAFVEELQAQHAMLGNYIEQLAAVEISRAKLVSFLREALQDQEYKLDQVRSQLQAARSRSDKAINLFQHLRNGKNFPLLVEQRSKDIQTSLPPQSYAASGERDQPAPVMYTRQLPYSEKSGQMEEDPRKSAAAAVAAQLTATASSAQMLTNVLSSLVSEGVLGRSEKDASGDYVSEKRPKLENDQSLYVPLQNSQQPHPPFPQPEPYQYDASASGQQPPLPPPSSPPPLPPLPPPIPTYQMPPPFLQAGAPMNCVPYNYSIPQHQPQSFPGYTPVGISVSGVSPLATPATTPYQGYPGSEGGFYNQPPVPMAPISRQ